MRPNYPNVSKAINASKYLITSKRATFVRRSLQANSANVLRGERRGSDS